MSQKSVNDTLESFFTQFPKRKLKRKEIILHADEMPQGIFYLSDGLIRQYAISKKGEEVVLNIFRSPSFFPLRQLFHEHASAYYYEAMSEVVVYVAPRDAVYAFLSANPDVLMDLIDRMSRGIEGLSERITYLMAGTAYERVIIEILLYTRRFGEKGTKTVGVRISAKQLAIQSGLTRETVTRELAVLKQNGFISFERNQLTVLDIEKLGKELGQE